MCQAGGRRRRRRNRRKEERRLEDATTCPGRSHSASSHLSTGPRPPPRRQTLANLGWTPVSLQWLRLSADPPGSGARDQDSRLQTRAPGAQGARSSAGPSQELRLSAAGGSANRGREGLPWCAPPKRSGVPKHLRSERLPLCAPASRGRVPAPLNAVGEGKSSSPNSEPCQSQQVHSSWWTSFVKSPLQVLGDCLRHYNVHLDIYHYGSQNLTPPKSHRKETHSFESP